MKKSFYIFLFVCLPMLSFDLALAKELKEWNDTYILEKTSPKHKGKCQSPLIIETGAQDFNVIIGQNKAVWSPVPLKEINTHHFVISVDEYVGQTEIDRRFYFVKSFNKKKGNEEARFILTEQNITYSGNKAYRGKERKEELVFSLGKNHEKILTWGPCFFKGTNSTL